MVSITTRFVPFNAQAITLWPIVLFRPEVANDVCVRAHEQYHWEDALRWGVLPWYLAYLLIGLFYIGKPADQHPLERGAYAAERRCRG